MQGKCTDNTRPEGQVAMWCKQRNGDGEKKKRLPDLLKAFLLLFLLFLLEPNGSGCARAGLAAHAEEHEQFDRSLLLCRNPLLIAPPSSALQWGNRARARQNADPGRPKAKPEPTDPGPWGFPSPDRRSGFEEGGRESQALPRRSRCAPRPHTRSFPRPRGSPSPARTPGACAEPRQGSGSAKQL